MAQSPASSSVRSLVAQAVAELHLGRTEEATVALLSSGDFLGEEAIAGAPGLRIITATAERLGMPLEKVIINIDRFGNTTAGTIPIAMQTAVDEGKLKKGDRVLVATVGAGFTSGATLLRWAF